MEAAKEVPRQLKRGEMRIFNARKQDLTKQVVGAVPGT
jgi:hypothetical protein